MILASITSSARRLATLGVVALLLAGCAVPTVTPTTPPSPLPTIPPTTPPYTLGPTVSASPFGCPTSTPAALSGTATVKMTTNFGDIVIKVDSSLGANAAGAFVALSRCGYYNNVIFHRIVPKFVIQAGDGLYARLPNATLDSKMGTGGPGWTVPDDKVTTTYKRGTVALARTSTANSGNSQFFIVLDDSAASTLGASTANNYAIFGNVTAGLDVVDRIAAVPLGGEPDGSGGAPAMPLEPVVITSTIVTTP
jgi:peptidyl-prolyl cis-trans isomerase B (cyclophilin B)